MNRSIRSIGALILQPLQFGCSIARCVRSPILLHASHVPVPMRALRIPDNARPVREVKWLKMKKAVTCGLDLLELVTLVFVLYSVGKFRISKSHINVNDGLQHSTTHTQSEQTPGYPQPNCSKTALLTQWLNDHLNWPYFFEARSPLP